MFIFVWKFYFIVGLLISATVNFWMHVDLTSSVLECLLDIFLSFTTITSFNRLFSRIICLDCNEARDDDDDDDGVAVASTGL